MSVYESVGWLAFSLVVTPGTRWLVAATCRPPRRFFAPAALLADLVWILYLWVASAVAGRYVERVPEAIVGYAAWGLAALLLSALRAALYQRLQNRVHPLRRYVGFVLAAWLLLALSVVPIAASDLFRQPYHPAWPKIDDLMNRFRYTYNPSGGGAEPEFPPWHDPGDAGLYYRDVTLTTADGLRLAAWYVPAPNSSLNTPNGPSVLLCHGLFDSKWTMLRLIPWLHEAGYNVLALDFRGHGASTKRPTTIGPEEALDVQAALDFLEAEGVGGRVGGLGMSLGAAALVNTALHDERLDALVLDSLFADWGDTDFAKGYRLPPDWLVPGVPSPEALLPRIDAPVLIIHGTADILTGVSHAQRLYEAANEPRELWINDSGHAWSAWTYPEQYQARVLSFLAEALDRPSTEK